MTDVSDAELVAHAKRAQDRVVLITGGASGIGKRMALQFASYGAKIVIGDIQDEEGQKVVQEINASGAEAIFLHCDVTSWEDQHALFKVAVSKFGRVDFVVPNAGVSEGSEMMDSIRGSQPTKPALKAIQINLIAVMYTVQLAMFYFGTEKHNWDKAVVFIGSMSSFMGIPMGFQYSTSKHALCGFMGSLYDSFQLRQIRLGLIAPFFTDTAILGPGVRLMLAGVPFSSIDRVSSSVVAAATNPDPSTNGCIWTIPDENTVFRLTRGEMNEGGYKILMDRVRRAFRAIGFIQQLFRTLSDAFNVLGTPLLAFAVAVALGAAIWKRVLEG